MPHRLKVLEQKTPTVKEIIEQLAKAESQEIQRLKQEMGKKNKKEAASFAESLDLRKLAASEKRHN